jgi:phosphoglycolate phosphatase-like HAD superfamily hydrolase
MAILENRREIYERDYLPSVRPFEGARDVIRTLSEQGGRVALATDCKGVVFRRYMSLLDAGDYITVTACGDDLEHGKPDPAPCRRCSAQAWSCGFANGHGWRHAIRRRSGHRGRYEGCRCPDRRVF